jgi:U3 small nucleolar RNA-associated protein 10
LIRLHSNKQIRQYKWAALDLARQVLESRGFLSQLANKGTSDMDTVFENQYLSLSEALLRLIDMLFAHERSLAMRDNVNASVMKQWRGIIRLANDVLGNVNRLLSLPSFMRIVCELLKHENPSIRRKSLLLFNEKVEALEENGDLTEKDLFLGVLPHLTAMIAIKAHPRDREAIEIAINKQTALVSLALLVKHFGKTDASAFMDVLSVITGEWALGHENRQVAASSIICLGVYCRELGPRVVPLLPRFMPVVLGYMEAAAQQQDTSQDSATLMKLSTLGLIDIMARHMPMFLSPYLSTILRHIFYPAFIGTNAEAQGDQVVHRTVAVLSQLASHVAPRLLLAPTFECRTELMKLGANALVQYYSFVGKIMDAMELADVQQYYKTTVKFFLNCFDLRTDLANQMAIEASIPGTDVDRD